MNEEEMLDIIDRIIKCNSLTYFGYNTVEIGYEALEKIVKQYKEQQEQIEKLEKNNKITGTLLEKYKTEAYILGRNDETKAMQAVIERHYISRDKIEDKMEELENLYKNKYDLYMGYKFESREQQDIEKQIEVLKELLGEEE